MNRDFEIVDNKAIVLTDDVGKVYRKVTNNIEDILICENNIEEMEEKLQNEENKIVFSKKKMKSGWLYIGCGSLWLVSSILNSMKGNWIVSFFNFLCVVTYTCMGYFGNVKSELKFIKATKSVIKELEDSLKREKEKLNELNKDKTNDLMYIAPSKKAIDKSEQIINLRKKLEVIHTYETYKSKFINYYKRGILKEKVSTKYWFDNEDYYLLEELIKNDLSKKEEKKASKQKVLKRK